MIDIAHELSLKLATFGQDATSKEVISRAIDENGWFTQPDICLAVKAIRCQMLDADKLRDFMSHYPTHMPLKGSRVGIIMAGNIPLVGFADLLCTLLAGCEAWVKPSSKDRVLMEYLCECLKEIEPKIPIYIYDDSLNYDAIIATGGTEANLYFEQRFKGVKRLCRSSRHSIAVLTGSESEEQLQLLAKDIYSYSGLGCRNVAMIFVPDGAEIKIPAAQTSQKYRNNYLQTKALATLSGWHFIDNGASIICDSKEFAHSLSTLSVYRYNSLEQVQQWIAEHDHELQCIVSNCIDHPRRVDFGQAQRPSLFDFADGVDTMEFLIS